MTKNSKTEFPTLPDLGEYRRDRCAFDGGYAVELIWPDAMREEDLEDFLYWLELIKRKTPRICRNTRAKMGAKIND